MRRWELAAFAGMTVLLFVLTAGESRPSSLHGQATENCGPSSVPEGKYITVAADTQIFVSDDYGDTWTATAMSPGTNTRSIAMSGDGKYQTAASTNGTLHVSNDHGATWIPRESQRMWADVAMSADGQRQTAGVSSGQIYVSDDYGETWTAKDSNRNWRGVAMSADGQWQTAAATSGQIYVSSDYGDTWTPKDSSRSWYWVAMSPDGQRQTAVVLGGQIYVSDDYGDTWTAKDSSRNWRGVAMNSGVAEEESSSSASSTPVPELSTWAMLGVLAACGYFLHRKGLLPDFERLVR